MAIIGSADLFLDVPRLTKYQFEEYSTHLFDEWAAYVEQVLRLPDYSLSLDVEEGSIKAIAKIATTLGFLYVGIGQYGSFMAGLQTIQSQVRTVGDYLGDRASAPFGQQKSRPKLIRRGESLAKINSLFVKVQRGEISVEEAMAESKRLFGDELDEAVDFRDELRSSLEQAPLLPKQLNLELQSDSEEENETMPKRESRRPRPSPPAPKPEAYRVEIWRDNRRGDRYIRVVSL